MRDLVSVQDPDVLEPAAELQDAPLALQQLPEWAPALQPGAPAVKEPQTKPGPCFSHASGSLGNVLASSSFRAASAEQAGSMRRCTEGLGTATVTNGAAGQAAPLGRAAGQETEADSLAAGSRGSAAVPYRSEQQEGTVLGEPGQGARRCQALVHRQGMAPMLQAWYDRCAGGLGTLATCKP